jgi:pilus assembly protein CpaC
MRRFLGIIFLLMISLSLSLQGYTADETLSELKLRVGEIKILSVSSPTRIVIGNPAIADVTDISKSEISISPKAAGITTLVYWDNFGEQSYRIKVFNEDFNEAKRRIDNLLKSIDVPDVYAQAQEDEGKIFLFGKVKTQQDKDRINTALGPLKDKTVDLIEIKEEETTIEIEAQVLELSKDALTTLGFSWPGTMTVSESTPFTSGSFSSMLGLSSLTRGAFQWQLDFLTQEGKARILSQPRLACQSGKEAELLVGGEKPILTTEVVSGGAGTQGTNVEYKEYGLKMKIKPTVMDNNRIKLVLNVEISEVGTIETLGTATSGIGTNSTTTTAKAYPLTKRNISTEVYVDNGQPLAIGGLIKEKESEDIRKTPGLGDIPILGWLFKKKTSVSGGGIGERGNMELFIALTPTIVKMPEEALAKSSSVIPAAPSISTVTSSVAPITQGSSATAGAKTSLRDSYVITPANTASKPLSGYEDIIQKRVIDNLVYPVLAKDAGFQGTVKLNLRISYTGKLMEAAVLESSGYKILDDSALSVARGIDSYPPFPPSVTQKDVWIEIPVVYQLN